MRLGAVAVLLGVASALPAQGYRLRLDSRLQGVSWRGLEADSIVREAARPQDGGGFLTPDGYAATCDERFCHYFRAGATLRGVPLVSSADLTAWGFGVPGLRFRGNARWGADLGDAARWPGTEPAVQLIEAYAEYARDAFTVQAGRQFLPSRLGSYGLDGGRVQWRPGTDGLDVAVYGGWGLARGAMLPVTSPALNPLDDFQPRDRQIVAGAEVGLTQRHLELRGEYRREVDPAVNYFVSERAAGSLAWRPVRRFAFTAGGQYDLAMGQWGSADVGLTYLGSRATVTVGGRRYLPFFDLWTIWGAFSPVAFHAYHGAVTFSPRSGLVLRARGERYIYEDAQTADALVSVEDRGWRSELGATWEPTTTWSLSLGHQAEFGPGAASLGYDGRVQWRPFASLALGAHAASLRRPLELRFSDASLLMFGGDVDWTAGPTWRLGASVTQVQEDRERPDAATMSWDQVRLAFRVTLLLGTDIQRPALPRAIRSGGDR